MSTDVFRRIISHAWLSLGVLLVVVILLTLGGKALRFVGDYHIFFSEQNPQLQAFEEMQKVFNKTDSVSIVVAPESGDVFSTKTLLLIQQLTNEAWQIPNSTRVDSITNFQHIEALEDDLLVEDLLLETGLASYEKRDRIRHIALDEPQLVGRIVSPNGDVSAISVTISIADDQIQTEVPETATFVRELVRKYERLYPDHKIMLSGVVMMNNSFIEQSQQDMATLVPLMFLVILVLLTVLLRSLSAMIATLVVIIATISSTLGIAGWLGFTMNTVTVNVPTMVMTLAVADCVHVITTMIYEMRHGRAKEDALLFSLSLNNRAVFLTSATTAIGFLTLNFSDSPPFQDLGSLVAIGVMLAYFFALTLLPALLKIMPFNVKPVQDNHYSGFERLADFVLGQRRWLTPLSVIFILAMIALIPRNQLNDVSTEYFSEAVEFRLDTDFMEAHLGGVNSISFTINSGRSSGINDPVFIQKLAEFTDWLRLQPEVDNVVSLVDTMRKLNRSMHGDDPSYYDIPAQQELIAQYLLVYEMSLPFGLDLNNQLDIDKSSTRITIAMQSMGSKALIEMENRASAWWLNSGTNYEVTAASPDLMFAHIGERNMPQALIGAFWALVLISVLIGLSLRSFRLAFVSLVPNLAPAAIGFGIWAIIDGNINLALSIVISVTLGIVVDDSVHFMSKYQHARLQGKSTEKAVRYAYASVGKALLITTIILVMGFSILTQSTFTLNSDMGLLTSIIIGVALVVDFILLPLMLVGFKQAKLTETEEGTLPCRSN
ncbi:RND family transporter [Corallincola luteus]|uniref:RND family transporter n=1 Tax=Corallincola luteus TaxID=1775177 RepID=A0ABY2ALF0_9GAMM|nr:MMPL family transporter [Corallincola luteus]TCI03748.1 RND family transporter [Corallincola luteus]